MRTEPASAARTTTETGATREPNPKTEISDLGLILNHSTITAQDRGQALLLLADDFRTMLPETRDALALMDFVAEEQG